MSNLIFTPALEQGEALSEGFDFLPLRGEILYDASTLVNIFLCLKDQHENAFLLESVENGDKWGRYSFIALDPAQRIEVRGGEIRISGQDQQEMVIRDQDPLEFLGEELSRFRSPQVPGLPKFAGGYLGYFSYDAVRYVEPRLKDVPPDDLEIPDILLFQCREVVAFDHLTHKLSIIVNIPAKGDYEENYREGTRRIRTLLDEVTRFSYVYREEKDAAEPRVTSNISREEYLANVEKAKEYIREGDIFQVVLSTRFEVQDPPSAFSIYRMLRSTNPSPYMYYLQTREFAISGASPEMLVNVESRRITTKPIAGTIRRGADEAEDRVNQNKLINDEKERAEHTMLVDLGRNDIGKVSRFGTVEVTSLMEIEKYSQLFHITSQVEGDLREDVSLINALKAVLPAGTLSGAPKVRAMEIIDELEKNKRCLYGGTIGYISFQGDMDTCIAIRTVLVKGGRAYIQAGAGIVYDSVGEKEYMECETKARAMIRAIKEAGRL